MRVALCLSGQPRNVVQNWDIIKNTLVEPNNAEVFLHTWIDPKNPSCNYYPKWIVEMHNHKFTSADQPDHLADWMVANMGPKGFWIEDGHDADRFPSYSESQEQYCLACHNAIDAWSMYASIFKANEIKKLYEEKHSFKYDYVIRTRFDICPYFRLPVESLDPGIIYTPNKFDGAVSIDDHLMISSSENLDRVAEAYLFLDVMTEQIGMEIQGESPMGVYTKGIMGMEPYKICPAGRPNDNLNTITREGNPPIDISDIQDGFETMPYEKRMPDSWSRRCSLASGSLNEKSKMERLEWIVGDQVRRESYIS